jgi:hypothetical protein
MAIEDLQNIETLYAINMFVYELKEDEMGNVHAELTRRFQKCIGWDGIPSGITVANFGLAGSFVTL